MKKLKKQGAPLYIAIVQHVWYKALKNHMASPVSLNAMSILYNMYFNAMNIEYIAKFLENTKALD